MLTITDWLKSEDARATLTQAARFHGTAYAPLIADFGEGPLRQLVLRFSPRVAAGGLTGFPSRLLWFDAVSDGILYHMEQCIPDHSQDIRVESNFPPAGIELDALSERCGGFSNRCRQRRKNS